MLAFRIILMLLICQRCVSQTQTKIAFFYSCRVLGNNNWELFVTVNTNGNPVDFIFGVDVVKNERVGDACSSNSTLSAVNPVQEITQTGNTYNLQIQINPITGDTSIDCGVQRAGAGGLVPGQYRWTFEVYTEFVHPAIRFEHEKHYNLYCDFNDPTLIQMETIVAQLEVNTGTPPPVIDVEDSGRLSVVLANNLSPVTVITTNDLMRLKAELNTVNVNPRNPPFTGVSPFNCKVCESQFCNRVVDLTDANGCVFVLNQAPTLGGLPFTNALSMSSTGAVLYTGSFNPFTFGTSLNVDISDVFFTCTFDFCDANTGPDLCIDRCGARTGRKKRNAKKLTEVLKDRPIRAAGNMTDTKPESHISVLLKIVSNVVSSDSSPVTGVLPKNTVSRKERLESEDPGRCEGFQGFLIAVGILGATLLIALCICICLCVKICTRGSGQETLHANGNKNKAFR